MTPTPLNATARPRRPANLARGAALLALGLAATGLTLSCSTFKNWGGHFERSVAKAMDTARAQETLAATILEVMQSAEGRQVIEAAVAQWTEDRATAAAAAKYQRLTTLNVTGIAGGSAGLTTLLLAGLNAYLRRKPGAPPTQGETA